MGRKTGMGRDGTESVYEQTARVLGQERADEFRARMERKGTMHAHGFKDGRTVTVDKKTALDGHVYYVWHVTDKQGRLGGGLGQADLEAVTKEAASFFGIKKWNVL